MKDHLPSPDPRRRSLLRGVFLAGLLPTALPLRAETVPLVYEGVTLPRRIELHGATLQLNGAGVRQVAWFKGYVAALYLTSQAATAAEAVAATGPKRIRMHLLHEVPTTELSKAVRKGVARNVDPGTAARLSPALEAFASTVDAIGSAQRGDVVDLDLDPARGLLLLHNGRQRGDVVPGSDFYSALLLSFVGQRPYDPKLRQGMLGARR